jgi:hypothetical protein
VGDAIREETKSCLKSRRDYATAARTIASNATTEEARVVFLRIAAQWEKEIDDIENGLSSVLDTLPPLPKPWSVLSYVCSLFISRTGIKTDVQPGNAVTSGPWSYRAKASLPAKAFSRDDP